MAETAVTFEVLATAAEVAAEAARFTVAAADRAIAERGGFRLVLAGGCSPLAAYRLLLDAATDWGRWTLFLGDERCLPERDEERNSTALRRAFVDKVPIPDGSVHWIPAELGAADAARRYEGALREGLPFDLVLLGMGEDGHTASLFPGHSVAPGRLAMPVYNSPKPPPERVSLTPRALADCRAMLVLATGAEKAPALAAWRSGSDLPVAHVASLGRARVLADWAAAGLPREVDV